MAPKMEVTLKMSEVKILYLKRVGSDFSESEKKIKLMFAQGWELISLTPDPQNQFIMIATFVK